MLCSENALRSAGLMARDGDMGRVHELYVDQATWQVMHVVADIGTWPVARLVLLSPDAIMEVDTGTPAIRTTLTRAEIEAAPSVSPQPPSTLHREAELHAHHDWPVIWTAGNPMVSGLTPDQAPMDKETSSTDTPATPNLVGTRDMNGYQVAALDGDAGQVDDLLVDCRLWRIPNIVVELGFWRRGQQVLVPVEQVLDISRDELKLTVGLTQAQLQDSPALDPAGLALPNGSESAPAADDSSSS